jgi:hypothetical protein
MMDVADIMRLAFPGPRWLSRLPRLVAVSAGTLLAAIAALVLPAVALTGVAFGVLTATVASVDTELPPTCGFARGTGDRRRGGLRAGGVVTAVWLIVTGLVVLLGPATAIVIVAILLTVPLPWVWRALRTGDRAARTQPRAEQADTRAAPTVALEDLTTPALCAAWQRSYFAMLEVPAGPDRYATLRMRERLLDELELRDPAGFARWLHCGARAGSDPGRYLAPAR